MVDVLIFYLLTITACVQNGVTVQPPIRAIVLDTVEGMRDLCEVARPDQPLATEQQLLTTTAQGNVRLFAERNHDVRETVKERVLIVVRDTIPPLEVSIDRHQRALSLDVHAKIRRCVRSALHRSRDRR